MIEEDVRRIEQPLRVSPLASTEFVVVRDDKSWRGANFVVEWSAGKRVTEPVVKAVMIDTSGQQGISFARRGMVISEKKEEQ